MKVQAKNFKGIEYVEVTQLPSDQHSKILLTINKNILIKILIDGKVVGNCLQYKDYLQWYEKVFDQTLTLDKTVVSKEKMLKIEV